MIGVYKGIHLLTLRAGISDACPASKSELPRGVQQAGDDRLGRLLR